jgi:hypothetical protein
MMLKALLPALNLLVLSPSLWVALAAAGGFVFGIYFERKKLYGDFTDTSDSKPPSEISRSNPTRRTSGSRAGKKKPASGKH